MARGSLILTAILLAGIIPPTAAGLPPVLHGAVYIASDADLTAANGVVAGTGTPGDPFIIAGWRFYAALGTAFVIENVTKHVVIRDNVFDGQTGVHVRSLTGVVVFENNDFHVRPSGVGILVQEATITIRMNAFTPHGSGGAPVGVSLTASNSVVVNNTFDFLWRGIVADRGRPDVIGNDLHMMWGTAIHLHAVVQTCVHENIVTDSAVGIHVDASTSVCVTANTVVNGGAGMEFWVNKDIDVANNTVRGSVGVGVLFESSSGNFTANVVVDGWVDAVHIWHSPLIMASNRIENNVGVGLYYMMSAAHAHANVVSRNSIGILVADEPAVNLSANVLTNNTIGLSIPYRARQTITWMTGNFVNGVNVDGTVVASHKVFFYKAANVQITGQVRDSGFSAGYYGSISAQGNVVLYEVDTANITATTISHGTVGVGIVNSFNVNVQGSYLSSNLVGVSATTAWANGAPVPNCVVTIKDTNVTIPVDPVATVGIEVRAGCFAQVLRTNVSLVDTGILVDATSRAIIHGSTVTDTFVGMELAGLRGELSVTGNVVAGNRIGARFTGSTAVVTDNRFVQNARLGVALAGASALDFQRNNVSLNGEGLVDLSGCVGGVPTWSAACSSVTASSNTFFDNRGDGARLNGTSTFQGDVFVGNRANGARLQSATLVGVNATANGATGASLHGTFWVRSSTFDRNGEHGARVVGSGDLRASSFRHNAHAGIRATATYVTAFGLNVSSNFDGILFDELTPTLPPLSVTVPTLSVPGLLNSLPGQQADPLDVHRSTFLLNQRDAIRAGAAIVNATHNYFGPSGPRVSVLDTVGAFQNGVSPAVRFLPYYTDPAMTTTGPVAGI